VSGDSAIFGDARENRETIRADHVGMTKFSSRDDSEYQKVLFAIETLLEVPPERGAVPTSHGMSPTQSVERHPSTMPSNSSEDNGRKPFVRLATSRRNEELNVPLLEGAIGMAPAILQVAHVGFVITIVRGPRAQVLIKPCLRQLGQTGRICCG